MPFEDIRVIFGQQKSVLWENIHVVVYSELSVFIAGKIEEFLDNNWKGKVYKIENVVIHNWHEKCITSKTMLYTIGMKSV